MVFGVKHLHTTMDTNSNFQCRFCKFVCDQPVQYLEHLRTVHRNLTSSFPCRYKSCDFVTDQENHLRVHFIRRHELSVRQLQQPTTRHPGNEDGKYLCTVRFCKQETDSFMLLTKHLNTHIDSGVAVECPYSGCNKAYSIKNSFSCHLSRHKMTDFKKSVDVGETSDSCSTSYAVENSEIINDFENGSLANDDISDIGSQVTSDVETIQKCITDFLMRIEFKCLVPESTVQSIVKEWITLNSKSYQIVQNKLRARLKHENLSEESIDSILSDVALDPFCDFYKSIGTKHLRKKLYKMSSFYVPPVKVNLPSGGFFYYVPVEETVKKLFTDCSRVFNVNGMPHREHNILKDFTDGLTFMNSRFFEENPRAIRLILYQDCFELVCPIGPAKKKHKILAVYLSIGNLPDHLRTHTSSIFLVALCKKKDFDHNSLYGYIVNKLKVLESTGIAIPGHDVVKAGLVFVVGDNLGSHELGGFNENFSKSHYFCRYCCINRKQFTSPYGYMFKGEARTPENYEAAVGQTSIKNKKGIKFNSAFNALDTFHVCEGGLPPCFGHDIFEGFAAYDVALIIHDIVEKEWVTYPELEERIKSFNYSSIDKRDKPLEFTADSTRVKGGAWQIWTFIKLLPLIMSNCIVKNDSSWLLLLLLIEIIEILCAPSIHRENVVYLHDLIVDYLKLRSESFPHVRLRPKHHYMLHYPELILMYGPLLKVWAMRFESKHSFFKDCIRSSRNFINVQLSLSVRHELYQSYLRAGGDVRYDMTVKKPVQFDLQLYSDAIQRAIGISKLVLPVEHCVSATVKGTVYKKGDAVVMRQQGYQCSVEVGRILFVLYDCKEKLHVLVENLETCFIPHMRVYKLGSILNYECVCIEDLLSPFPLYVYNVNGFSCIKFKHGLVSKKI